MDWPTPTLEEQAWLGAWTGEPSPAVGTLSHSIRTAYSGALVALRDFANAEEAIERDVERSDVGKAKARAQVAKEVLAKVHEHQARFASFRRDRDSLLEPIQFLPKTDGDRIIAHLEAAELRAHLGRIDPLERQVVLRECAERGDLPTLAAVKSAPSYAPLADDGLIAELERITLQAVAPSKAAALEAADRDMAAADNALAAAHRHLAQLGGMETADPIAQMAVAENQGASNDYAKS